MLELEISHLSGQEEDELSEFLWVSAAECDFQSVSPSSDKFFEQGKDDFGIGLAKGLSECLFVLEPAELLLKLLELDLAGCHSLHKVVGVRHEAVLTSVEVFVVLRLRLKFGLECAQNHFHFVIHLFLELF